MCASDNVSTTSRVKANEGLCTSNLRAMSGMYAQGDTGEAIMATKEWVEIFRLDVVEAREA